LPTAPYLLHKPPDMSAGHGAANHCPYTADHQGPVNSSESTRLQPPHGALQHYSDRVVMQQRHRIALDVLACHQASQHDGLPTLTVLEWQRLPERSINPVECGVVLE